LSAPFDVDQPPRLQDGRWRMTVDGVELTRIQILPLPTPRPGPEAPTLRL
jgi:hypothetical protein